MVVCCSRAIGSLCIIYNPNRCFPVNSRSEFPSCIFMVNITTTSANTTAEEIIQAATPPAEEIIQAENLQAEEIIQAENLQAEGNPQAECR